MRLPEFLRLFPMRAPNIMWFLERLTKRRLDETIGNEAAGQFQEAQVDVITPVPADEQTAVAVQPGEGALDLPAVTA